VLALRNHLIINGWLLMAMDMYNSWMHANLLPFKKNVGMERTWMAFCFIGSLSVTFGSHWLHKELLMLAGALFFCILPAWTPAILYMRYNSPDGTKFQTWWYFALTAVQFWTGILIVYLYARYTSEMKHREQEEELR
jgi:uncharacterized membrane protein